MKTNQRPNYSPGSAASKSPFAGSSIPYALTILTALSYKLPRIKLFNASSSSSLLEKLAFNFSICSSVNFKTTVADLSESSFGFNKSSSEKAWLGFMGRPENQLSTVLLLTPINEAKSCLVFPLDFNHSLILSSSSCCFMVSNYARKRNLSSFFYARKRKK